MLWGARRVTIQLSVFAPVPLDTARVVWGDGDRIDLPRDQVAQLQVGTAVYITHVYLFAATPYQLHLTVQDTDGQQATASAAVLVRNQPPHLAVDIHVDGQAVTGYPTATDPDGEIIDISLYWGGREGAVHHAISGQPLTHQYPNGGLWELLTTATDDEGASVAVRHAVSLLTHAEAAARWGLSPGARGQERKTQR